MLGRFLLVVKLMLGTGDAHRVISGIKLLLLLLLLLQLGGLVLLRLRVVMALRGVGGSVILMFLFGFTLFAVLHNKYLNS